jgi:hypothetical protein
MKIGEKSAFSHSIPSKLRILTTGIPEQLGMDYKESGEWEIDTSGSMGS